MVSLPIGGFMPIPLAMMIPFMATQSMVMGQAFGMGFQYGKRKISAMDNETFNKTTMEQVASEMFVAYEKIIPNLKVQMADNQGLQNFIIAKLLDMPRDLISDFFNSITGQQTSQISDEEQKTKEQLDQFSQETQGLFLSPEEIEAKQSSDPDVTTGTALVISVDWNGQINKYSKLELSNLISKQNALFNHEVKILPTYPVGSTTYNAIKMRIANLTNWLHIHRTAYHEATGQWV